MCVCVCGERRKDKKRNKRRGTGVPARNIFVNSICMYNLQDT